MQYMTPYLFRIFAALLAVVLALPACAQTAAGDKDYTPTVGQEGKDVIWVPTPQALVEKMLDMAKLTAQDIHYDLGSGDGRTVITAAKRGAQAFGVEFNPDMVALAQRAAAKEGVAGKAKFIHGDIFQTDFGQATVVTLYLLPSLNVKLRPTLLKMKPGTRVVSHAFTMDEWQPDQTENVEGRTAYLWIVPAPVEGTWRWNGWATDRKSTRSRCASNSRRSTARPGSMAGRGSCATSTCAATRSASRCWTPMAPAATIPAASPATPCRAW